MNRQTKGSRRYRLKLWIGWICILTGLLAPRVNSHHHPEINSLICRPSLTEVTKLTLTLPDTPYLVSDTYGWFDPTHFNTGRPGQVLRDVRQAVANGGDVMTIRQGVRDGITGYTAAYQVSAHLQEADVVAAALGIYLDWSVRFEAWQGQPPHGLAGPLTPFAIEDLPSQYLGFYAQAHDMTVADLFACYLGPVAGSDSGPPHFVMLDWEADSGDAPGIARLQNKTFTPLVETDDGWRHVAWPQPMQMTPLAGGAETWRFLSETTWYLDEDVRQELITASVLMHLYHELRAR